MRPFFVVIGWSPCHGVWFSVYHAAWMNSTGCRYILPGDGNALELRTTQPTSLGIRIWRSIWCAMARFSDQDQMDLVLKQWHHVNGTLNSLYSRLQVLRAIQHTLPSEFTGTNAWYKSEKNRRDKKSHKISHLLHVECCRTCWWKLWFQSFKLLIRTWKNDPS